MTDRFREFVGQSLIQHMIDGDFLKADPEKHHRLTRSVEISSLELTNCGWTNKVLMIRVGLQRNKFAHWVNGANQVQRLPK